MGGGEPVARIEPAGDQSRQRGHNSRQLNHRSTGAWQPLSQYLTEQRA